MIAMPGPFHWCARQAERFSNAYQACTKANIKAAFRTIPTALRAIRAVAPPSEEMLLGAGSIAWGTIIYYTLISKYTLARTVVTGTAVVLLPVALYKAMVPRRMTERAFADACSDGAVTSLVPIAVHVGAPGVAYGLDRMSTLGGRAPSSLAAYHQYVLPFLVYKVMGLGLLTKKLSARMVLGTYGYAAGYAIAGLPGGFIGGLAARFVVQIREGFAAHPDQLQRIVQTFRDFQTAERQPARRDDRALPEVILPVQEPPGQLPVESSLEQNPLRGHKDGP